MLIEANAINTTLSHHPAILQNNYFNSFKSLLFSSLKVAKMYEDRLEMAARYQCDLRQ